MSHGIITGVTLTFTCVRCGDAGTLDAHLVDYSVSNPVKTLYSSISGQTHVVDMGGSSITGTFSVFTPPYHCPSCKILIEKATKLKKRIGL